MRLVDFTTSGTLFFVKQYLCNDPLVSVTCSVASMAPSVASPIASAASSVESKIIMNFSNCTNKLPLIVCRLIFFGYFQLVAGDGLGHYENI